MAVASLHAGTRNVRPQASALICCHTALRAPPPSEYTVSAGQPRAFSMPKKSRSRNATDSITLRANLKGLAVEAMTVFVWSPVSFWYFW